MRNGGLFEKNRTNSLGLGVVAVGHLALLTAIAVNPTRFGPRIDYIQVIKTITEKQPPPPEQLPTPQQTRAEIMPEQIDPLVKTELPLGGPIQLQPFMQDPGPIRPPIYPPEPIFRQASIDPSAIARFQPDYPSAMVRAGIEGSVTVRVLIGTDGRVRAIELVNATNPAFFDVTRDHALRAWRFLPATSDGAAIENWRTMTVKFRLES